MGQVLNFRQIGKVVGIISFIIFGSLLLTAMIAIIYSEDVWPLLNTSLISLVMGGVLTLISRRPANDETIQWKDAFLTVTGSWFYISIIGALP